MIVTVDDVLERIRQDSEMLVIRLKVIPTNKEANRINRLLSDLVRATDAHYHRADQEVRVLYPRMNEGAIQQLENELTVMLAKRVFETRRSQQKKGKR